MSDSNSQIVILQITITIGRFTLFLHERNTMNSAALAQTKLSGRKKKSLKIKCKTCNSIPSLTPYTQTRRYNSAVLNAKHNTQTHYSLLQQFLCDETNGPLSFLPDTLVFVDEHIAYLHNQFRSMQFLSIYFLASSFCSILLNPASQTHLPCCSQTIVTYFQKKKTENKTKKKNMMWWCPSRCETFVAEYV